MRLLGPLDFTYAHAQTQNKSPLALPIECLCCTFHFIYTQLLIKTWTIQTLLPESQTLMAVVALLQQRRCSHLLAAAGRPMKPTCPTSFKKQHVPWLRRSSLQGSHVHQVEGRTRRHAALPGVMWRSLPEPK